MQSSVNEVYGVSMIETNMVRVSPLSIGDLPDAPQMALILLQQDLLDELSEAAPMAEIGRTYTYLCYSSERSEFAVVVEFDISAMDPTGELIISNSSAYVWSDDDWRECRHSRRQ